ncbi:DUF4468 domain-containing protein [Tenacibaculum finnmarkense]|uniref:DUF4468 domain-containing protein n=1 Tax=Tenacibaculum finnmarkense TaxID=2781243 RepID=UPI001EFB01CE|nr:DUF4468 domain-containing protein [Tenacibaculum finnmarkense]MCG8808478.1 DUF4468 domain-containing protein [Tenacibaculum finnmarkense]MCG8813409.1 DUF4468 domain-containing protein [Tenacibaculum finnmarkense]MCG8818799.1 DUF4468 domain-containing protein [Tenacibaculum finnmarkense]MCG8893748.1 DUF4468 domain-containing protein [Tenacibaculum finnmarkense]MCG8901235.1 DUF4468 domain-containing protein [Tenacibaculum finnmarkense]
MKKIICLLTTLITISTFSQKKEFKFNKEGFTDYVVTQCEGRTESELYKKALDWVSVTYKNPKEVIKAQIENDYIKIEGSSNDLACFNIYGHKGCNTSKYTIEISFKDGKYKFDVLGNIRFLYSEGSWGSIRLDKTSKYYKKKGEIKRRYKYFPEIANYFNKLNSELKSFLMSENIPSKKSDW